MTAMEFYKLNSRKRRLDRDTVMSLLRMFMQEHSLYGWNGNFGLVEIDAETDFDGWVNFKARRILINPFSIKRRTPTQIKDLILHEIAHALVGRGGHGVAWSEKAREIGERPSAIALELCSVGNYSLSRKFVWQINPYWRTHSIPRIGV
jgi:hypothetical protein